MTSNSFGNIDRVIARIEAPWGNRHFAGNLDKCGTGANPVDIVFIGASEQRTVEALRQTLGELPGKAVNPESLARRMNLTS